jgi:hypothetical protein
MKTNHAIFIDAENNRVSIEKIKHYTDISKLGKYDIFTCVRIDKNDCIYVDDEGLINGTKYGFMFNGEPLMGNGIILGVNPETGETLSAEHTIEELIPMLRCFRKVSGIIISNADRPNW